MADPPKCHRCFTNLDIVPPTCLYCKHWKPLQPGEPFFNTNSPGAVGKCHHPTPYENLGRLHLVIRSDRCHQFEERASVRPTCQTCAFWTRLDSLSAPHAGKCNSPKFVFASHYHDLDVDGLMYITYDGNEADLETGEAFGCIHYQPRT